MDSSTPYRAAISVSNWYVIFGIYYKKNTLGHICFLIATFPFPGKMPNIANLHKFLPLQSLHRAIRNTKVDLNTPKNGTNLLYQYRHFAKNNDAIFGVILLESIKDFQYCCLTC